MEETEIPETLGGKVDRLARLIEDGDFKEKKSITKKFRMPLKGKISKSRLKQGYTTVLVIGENNTADFTREPIVDGTIKLGDTFHAADSDDCLTYKGRPLLIIAKKSNVPYNPNHVKNTTFSQKHIMSRMMNETLDKAKKLGIGAISIGAVILIAVIAYAFIAG